MTADAVLQVGLLVAAILVAIKPLGLFMARVFEGRIPLLLRLLVPVERLMNWLAGVKPDNQMSWRKYASSALMFSVVSFAAV